MFQQDCDLKSGRKSNIGNKDHVLLMLARVFAVSLQTGNNCKRVQPHFVREKKSPINSPKHN